MAKSNGLGSAGSEQRPVNAPHEHNNGPFEFQEIGEFLDKLSNY